MELAQALGRRIRALRKERGLTQEQLAYTADGISSKGYLSEIEAGKRLPSLNALAAIAERLGVEPFELLVFPGAGPKHDQVLQLLRLA